MASFSAGTTFTDGVANDVTAAKLGALVNNATPLSGLIQDRTAETITATNDTLLIGDASDSNALKRITVANFAQTLPTAKITTGTIETGTFGTTTSTAATITTGTITTGVIPTLTAGTTTSTAATITTGTIPTLVATTLITSGAGTAAAPAIVPTGDTNTGIFYPAADTAAISTQGTERVRVDSSGNVGIGTASVASTATSGFAFLPSSTSYAYINGVNGTGSIWLGNNNDGSNASNGVNCGSISFRARHNGVYDGGSDVASIYGTYTGNGTTRSGAIRFITVDSGSEAERLRIDSSGNVGIGTTSPSTKLHVDSGSAAQYGKFNSTAANGGYLTFESSSTVHGDIGTAAQVVSGGSASDFGINARGSRNLVLGTNNTERLRIDSSGFVSIGTATALSALHVHGNVTLSNTTTATSAGTGGLSKPATYAGYLTVSINGTSRKIPYYAT